MDVQKIKPIWCEKENNSGVYKFKNSLDSFCFIVEIIRISDTSVVFVFFLIITYLKEISSKFVALFK